MLQRINGLLKDQKGQGMVEYALILAVVAVVALAGFGTLGNTVNTKANAVAGNITNGK